MLSVGRLRYACAALVALVLTVGAGLAPAISHAAPTGTSAAEHAIQPLRDADIPGWTVLVTESDGSVRTRVSHGSTKGRKVTGRTPFLLGSVAKSFTATLIAQLVQEGAVRLDSPVRTYLPDFTLADGRGHSITVRQLLTHTSGISAGDGLTRADRPDQDPGATRRLVRSLREATPEAEPGVEHIYSSANYLVLGALVERITGQSFREALSRRVLQPLGMSSAVTSASSARAKHLIPGHRYAFGSPRDFGQTYVSSGVPYGYLGASADDVARYARFHAGTDPAPRVLTDKRIRALHRPQVRTGPDEHYAMGWRLTRYDGLKERVVQHTGATPGSFAHVLIDPRSGRTVVVLANAYSEAIAPALYGVGPDLLRAAEGTEIQPQQPNPLLGGAAWAALALAVLGIVVMAGGLRGLIRGPRSRRWVAAVGAALSLALAVGCAVLPHAFGLGWRELRLWMLDLAIGATAAGVVWLLAALLLVAVVVRPRS